MLNVLLEAIKIIVQVFLEFLVAIIKMIYEISGLPMSQYGLVRFFAEKNIIIFNSTTFTNIIMFITPLIVTHILCYLTSLIGIKSIKVKEGLSIALYLMILYLFSSWITWLVIGVLVLIFAVEIILSNTINQKIMN